MYSQANCMALFGMEGVLIHVECDTSNGLPEISLVGYLGAEVREARDRVRTAMRNTGFMLPPRRITVNLAPADIRKEGTSFDLAIAVAMLCSAELVDLKDYLDNTVFIGELGLDGRLMPVSGVLTMVGAAKAAGYSRCVVPAGNGAEGALVEGIEVIGLESLDQLPLLAAGKLQPLPCRIRELLQEEALREGVDYSEVNGQRAIRRAAEVAAAGRHNMLMIGSPGSGKTMAARRIPTILPRLSLEEALEVSRIYSICGLLSQERPLILTRPFRSPHHTVSSFALVGGGRVPRPGEISLADHGVLFLDELPEFQKTALEALRQPLEDREVSIARVQGSFRFPADVMLVAAMNPCRCGYFPDRNRCRCSEGEVSNYLRRISRPLLDRMDLMVEAPPLGYGELTRQGKNESSEEIRLRVEAARSRQVARFQDTPILFNARMNAQQVRRYCLLNKEQDLFLKQVFEQKGLSARAYHRILKVARTIADLRDAPEISLEDLAEAVGYRAPAEKFWR